MQVIWDKLILQRGLIRIPKCREIGSMSMSKKARRWALLAAMTAGTTFQVGTNGCADYYAIEAFSAFDFCSVFNCTGGTFFDFCNPVPLFADCPVPPTGP